MIKFFFLYAMKVRQKFHFYLLLIIHLFLKRLNFLILISFSRIIVYQGFISKKISIFSKISNIYFPKSDYIY